MTASSSQVKPLDARLTGDEVSKVGKNGRQMSDEGKAHRRRSIGRTALVVALFAALALLMRLTRKIDWYARDAAGQ